METFMRLLVIVFFLMFMGCSDDDPSGPNGNGNGNGNGNPPPPGEVTYDVTPAFPNLSFNQPLDLQYPGDGSGRLFVVERPGVIHVFENDSSVDNSSVFLDIQNRVDDGGQEEGLLGLAFHPDYENNGYFYVNYTAGNPDRTVISRFRVSDNPDEADANSETEILTFPQPFSNHNGGQLAFGPDGYLYIAVGDGGGAGDPNDNGQDRTTLLGSILRIDVDSQENGNNYGIPSDNPYAGNEEGYREEIFAYGLRNPWRFSFDADNGDIWAGDVGQNSYEEIDIIEAGNNYGWNIMEGTHCFEPPSGCDQSGLAMPVWEYGRGEGISVTGGFVYRGPSQESLTGWYVYGDFGSGKIWALDASSPDDPENIELVDTDHSISSFGVDAENELYIVGFGGSIYRLEAVSEEGSE